MTEVAPVDGTASEPLPATTEEVVAKEAPTETDDAEATYKERLAGKDRALTTALRERDAAAAKTRELEDWKAQQERSSMTEVERLRAELEDRDSRLSVAEQEARAAKLEARFPAAYAATNGQLLDEATLASLESTLGKAGEPSTPTVPNSAPRRAASTPVGPKTSAELEADLKSIPNPYENWGR